MATPAEILDMARPAPAAAEGVPEIAYVADELPRRAYALGLAVKFGAERGYSEDNIIALAERFTGWMFGDADARQ